ncbi:MAG: hypothetical protein IT564_11075 [Rhodospirillales bacterium]|nr:hypothetical protein [Rhodospirillales bacterium]
MAKRPSLESIIAACQARVAGLSGTEPASVEVRRANLKGATVAPESLHRPLNCRRPK